MLICQKLADGIWVAILTSVNKDQGQKLARITTLMTSLANSRCSFSNCCQCREQESLEFVCQMLDNF